MKQNLSLALCAAVGLSLVGCAAEEPPQLMDTTVAVKTTVVERGSLSNEATYIGTISAEGTASVIPLVAGRVEEIYVSVGDTVSAGQTLCRLDDESARLTLQNAQMGLQSAQKGVESAEKVVKNAQMGVESAQMGVESAEIGVQNAQNGVNSAQTAVDSVLANYGADENGRLTVLEEQVSMAESNYKNTKALFEAGIASQIELDQAYQSMLAAQAGLEAAYVSIEQAKGSVESAKIGVESAQIGVENAQMGVENAQMSVESAQLGVESAQLGVETAQVGVESAEYQLSLYRLSTPISGVVEAINVTKNNFASSGMPAFVISNGNNKTVTFYVTDTVRQTLTVGQSVSVSVNGKDYSGSITEVSGIVDASAGLFQIKAVVDSASDLPDGLVVEVSTKAYEATDAVILPSDALYFEDGVAYVYLVQDGTAVRSVVEVGLYTRDTIAVTGGLEAGSEVITSWSSTLKDGAAIRVEEIETAPTREQDSEAE